MYKISKGSSVTYRWLNCLESASNEAYCDWKSESGLIGNLGKGKSDSEKFQIDSANRQDTNPIHNRDDVGFKYYINHEESWGRGKGSYWLSTSWGSNSYHWPRWLYTERCPGTRFTTSDLLRCDKEAFITEMAGNVTDTGILRHGDGILLSPGTDVYNKRKLRCFIVKQFDLKPGDYQKNDE